ncbi:MAG: DUF4143 domain-containing protein [bacterium]|nr:DUF4143 domain-containing protein [bacterium]
MSMLRSRHYHRRLLETSLRRIRSFPVVVLEGPRTVGKSTLLREIAQHLSADIVDLDDSIVRNQVEADPNRYLAEQRPVLIDEYLRLPLLDHIKAQLNRDGSPGQFILTGSAGRQANREELKALVGRLDEVEVFPLSQNEIEGVGGNFVESVFRGMEGVMSGGRSRTTREDYVGRVLAGGFPRVVLNEDPADRYQIFNNYIEQSLSYGLSAVRTVRRPEDVQRLLVRLGAQTGQILNIANAARDIGIAERTAENHTRLLEWLFFIVRLPAWKKTDRGPVSRPKLHLVDSGVGGHLLRLTSERVMSNDPLFQSSFGNLLESFMVSEIRKAIGWLNDPYRLGHWRTRQGVEVDLVLERLDDRAVVGMEVKSASGLSRDDWRGLVRLRAELGTRFHAGIVFYTGDMPYEPDDRIYAVPIDRLWSGEPETPKPPRAMAPSILTAAGDPLSPSVRAAADKMLERLELGEAAWWELAIVPSSNVSFSDFYSSDGVMGELTQVVTHSLRLDHGFGLGNGYDVEPVDQCVALIEGGARGVLIDPLGTMVAIAGSSFLCDPHVQNDISVTRVNHEAVKEWALEFARFSYRVLIPQGQGVSWTLWSRGRRLREGRPPLQVRPFNRQGVVDNPPHRGIPLTGDPEVDAFYLMSSFYEWFGIPAASLGEAKEGRVSAEEFPRM